MRTLGARQTELIELDVDEALDFIQEHHRQGIAAPGSNPKAYGLKLNDELLAVAFFCNPRTSGMQKRYTTELFRMAFKIDVRVQGGASKLIKHFLSTGPWDLFTYQDTAGETTAVYSASGLTLVSEATPKEVLVRNGITHADAKNNRKDWFSIEQAVTLGPDRLLGVSLGEKFHESGKRKTNVELFIEDAGYHLEEIPGDRIYEWRNPNVSFYVYKITSNADSGYYIGRHMVRKAQLTVTEALEDGYMGSGGKLFQGWVTKVGAETLQKEISSIHKTWPETLKAETKTIGNLHLNDPDCKNFQPGGTGLARRPISVRNGDCEIHGATKFQGASCMKCAAGKGFKIDDCVIHGTTVFHGENCSRCVAAIPDSIKICSIHGEAKHRGESCMKCSSAKSFTIQNCTVHGATIFRGEQCATCLQVPRWSKGNCLIHGETTFAENNCVKCRNAKTLTLKECLIHGNVLHFGETCATCTAQNAITLMECAIHGATKHQGSTCSKCNSEQSVSTQTCIIHGETKFQGSNCMKCNSSAQFSQLECAIHGVTLHKGRSCTLCTAQNAISLKECAVHGLTKHQGDVCSSCNAQKSISMLECAKHGLSKHQGTTCNKCNAQKSITEKDCAVHGLTKFQGAGCVKCRNAELIKVRECAVHGPWKHRGASCYACVSDRRKAAKLEAASNA